ncbi:heavy-metal-associated domain-containing protein [Desulfoscipio gibsoniae]|uniref:Cation transport ATPase n=1 Tax=Desulfoscipio gibsoniae DSM 7213 TaxID=767817 RepID=R4KAY5_9FIRM|nr:heavy-metal-associated domain-containing protein [Desulfoscipio gibsoniae]AGK99728.1 cation transport ATPase [Desulfoscipio gibsoniae DSM 7213]
MGDNDRTVRETVWVGGLHDADGGREIEHNLIQVDGVEHVQVELNEGAVTVDYDPAVISGEYLRRTLNSLGYSPYVRY